MLYNCWLSTGHSSMYSCITWVMYSHTTVTWVTWVTWQSHESKDSHMTVTWQSHESKDSHMTVTWRDTHLQIGQGTVSLSIHSSVLCNVIKSELQNREHHTRSQTCTSIVSPIVNERERCTIHLRTKPPLNGKLDSNMYNCCMQIVSLLQAGKEKDVPSICVQSHH